jgi:hypothetical protein
MTKYTVVWDSQVEAHFITAWVHSDPRTRAILTDVANWIDANLAVDADLKGQEEESVRILSVPITTVQISVAYEVFPEDRLVRVLRLTFRR